MAQVWAELRYGANGHGMALCRLDNPYLLKVFKKCVLSRATHLTEESEGTDEIIHLLDQMELEKLQTVLEMLIPNGDEDRYEPE